MGGGRKVLFVLEHLSGRDIALGPKEQDPLTAHTHKCSQIARS